MTRMAFCDLIGSLTLTLHHVLNTSPAILTVSLMLGGETIKYIITRSTEHQQESMKGNWSK